MLCKVSVFGLRLGLFTCNFQIQFKEYYHSENITRFFLIISELFDDP